MKRIKFLKLGMAIVLLSAGLTSGQANAGMFGQSPERTFSKEINSLIEEFQENGFLNELTDVMVKVAKPVKLITKDGEEFIFPPSLSDNVAYIIKKACKITLTYGENGDSIKLAVDAPILEATEFQNENQKKMMREFIALHESFHCELGAIENPIVIEGKSKDFSEKINYYLKDFQSETDFNGKVSYFGTLTEVFSDVGATGLLLKKYGENNPDLNFVLRAIKTQRHAAYFSVEKDNHFTHLGMENALSSDSVKKLINAKSGDEYKSVVLEIANKSVQQLITQRPDIAEEMFSKEKLESSVAFHIVRDILNNSSNEDQKNMSMLLFRKSKVENGFAKEMAKDFFNGEERHLTRFSNISSINEYEMNELVKYTMKLYSKKSADVFLKRDLEGFDKYIAEFKDAIFSQNRHKINDFDLTKKRKR